MQETMYKKLFQAAPVPLIVTDETGTIRLANEQADVLLDSRSDSLVGLGFRDFIDQSFLRSLYGGKPGTTFKEFLRIYKARQSHWFKSSAGVRIYADIKAVPFGPGMEDLYIWTFDPIEVSRKLTYDLNERVKEQLSILTVIELCFENQDIPTTLQRCLQPIRDGWRFPAAAEVRISLSGGAVFATDCFEKTEWCLESEIRTVDVQYGVLELCYRHEVPSYGGQTFLYEEERLIDVLGKILGTVIAHWHSSKRVNEAVVNAQEEERYQLAMELHDNVQQILTAASLNIDFLESLHPDGIARELTRNLKTSIAAATQELRRLSQQLAPSTDPEIPLTEKINFLVNSMGVNGRLRASIAVDAGIVFSEKIQLGFYRIIQEQLTNIIKHAKTPEVAISIRAEGSVIILSIADEGVGFEVDAKKGGIGFENIRRRAEFMNGTLHIASAPGKGTRVTVKVPMP